MALRFTRAGGTVVMTGLASTPGNVDWTPIWLKELTLLGTYAYAVERYQGRKMHTFELALDLMKKGLVDLNPLVTHRFKLEDYRQALEAATAKGRHGVIKAAFEFG